MVIKQKNFHCDNISLGPSALWSVTSDTTQISDRPKGLWLVTSELNRLVQYLRPKLATKTGMIYMMASFVPWKRIFWDEDEDAETELTSPIVPNYRSKGAPYKDIE